MINNKKLIYGLTGAALAAVYALLIFRQVAVGVHIDEEVMTVMGYRFVQGDKFFIDIQEPQLLIAPLIGMAEKIWLTVNGSTEGILIYMKLLTYCMLAALTIYVFQVLKNYLLRNQAFPIGLIFHFYHFRYINVMDYTFIFSSASLLCILLWMNYEYSNHKSINVIWGALSFCLMVICFPTAALLFPVYVYLYYKKCGVSGIGIIIGVCITAAVIQCTVLFRGQDAAGIPGLVRTMVEGSPYAKNMSGKLKRISIILICLWGFIVSEKAGSFTDRLRKLIKKTPVLIGGGEFVSCLLLLYGLFLLIRDTCINLEYFSKEGYCYLLLFAALQILVHREYGWLFQLYIWGIVCDSLVFFMTRYETLYVYALTSLLAAAIILVQKVWSDSYSIGTRWLFAASFVLFLFIQLYSKEILMISNNNHSGDTVFNQQLMEITEGPAKGSIARMADVEKYRELYFWITENIKENKKICYFGKNVLVYMMSPYIEAAVPQLFMDYSSDQVLGNYYLKRREKIPDIVILDISPTTKRYITEEEMKLFADYTVCYLSDNYKIIEK